jgi:hypothetical protein
MKIRPAAVVAAPTVNGRLHARRRREWRGGDIVVVRTLPIASRG